ncbi:MAG: sulfotransferase [Paraglaciecola sp.]|uniref:tetratricopeptide repeat-containing sulfotransferase family protein n=1 Tax=Paraglaciecola sp. TaxID=1920173 RepID=UPI0032997519
MSKNDIKQLHIQAQQLVNKGRFKEAHHCCLQILSKLPNHPDAHFLLGMIALNMRQMSKAIGLIEVAINNDLHNPEYYAFYARVLSLVNRHKDALIAVDKALALHSPLAVVNDTLAVVLSRLGDHERAVTLFKKAINKQPNNPSFHYNLAASLKFMGEFTLAKNAYEKVISLKSNYYQAHSALAELQLATRESNNIQRLQIELTKVGNDNIDGKLHVCHALAKELECLGEYQKALNILQRGNSAKKKQLNYTIDQDKSLFKGIESIFKDKSLSNKESDCTTDRPIFVLGMPRSGTTLVDRILSSHSQVMSVGESQNFAVELKKLTRTQSSKVLDLDTIAAIKNISFTELGNKYTQATQPVQDQAKYFVDKMPLNFLYIGLIKKALPNAKIIILDRQVMDVCLSNFRTLFAVNFSYYNYAYDLNDCAEYLSLFKNLMEFWQSIYSDELLQISYEKLVAEPEEQIKRLLDYCELDWQDNCLNFHENPSPVSTASSVQVRQPMNANSIGRWQRYGTELDEIQSFLSSKGLM